MRWKIIFKKVFVIWFTSMVIFILIGSLKFYADLIQGLDWTGFSFYTCLILAIIWKLEDLLRDLPDLICNKQEDKTAHKKVLRR